MEGPSSFLDAPDPQPSDQLIMTEGVSNVILGLVPWLRTGAPLLLVGPEGCGKATLLQHCLAQLAVRCPPTQPCTSILCCCLLNEHAQFTQQCRVLLPGLPLLDQAIAPIRSCWEPMVISHLGCHTCHMPHASMILVHDAMCLNH